MAFWGILFILLGLWCVLSPQSVIDFKVKAAKMMGTTLKFGKKAIKMYRYLGVFFIVLGLILMMV